jgi:hypothetical protein
MFSKPSLDNFVDKPVDTLYGPRKLLISKG